MAQRLTESDRCMIKYLREQQWKSRRGIAKILWRKDHTALMREYKNNKKRWWSYDPKYAHHKVQAKKHYKKKQSKKIVMDPVVENYIIEKLQGWWSPEIIAGRRNTVDAHIHDSKITISGISIRRYCNSKYARVLEQELKDKKLLKHYKQKAKHGKRQWWVIKHRIFIDARPLYVCEPSQPWHYECDFIESIRWDTTVLLVLIDKLTRVRYAYLLPNKNSHTVHIALMKCITDNDIKTITFDNDPWFSLHRNLWIPTYFCHTYSSREKWLIEWSNRWYRVYFPKKTELWLYTQADFDRVTYELNNKPMKCLWYKTPFETQQRYEYQQINVWSILV